MSEQKQRQPLWFKILMRLAATVLGSGVLALFSLLVFQWKYPTESASNIFLAVIALIVSFGSQRWENLWEVESFREFIAVLWHNISRWLMIAICIGGLFSILYLFHVHQETPVIPSFLGFVFIVLLIAWIAADASYRKLKREREGIANLLRDINQYSELTQLCDLKYSSFSPSCPSEDFVKVYRTVIKRYLKWVLQICIPGRLHSTVVDMDRLVAALFLCDYEQQRFITFEHFSENATYELVFESDVLNLKLFDMKNFIQVYNKFVDKKQKYEQDEGKITREKAKELVRDFRKAVKGFASTCGIVVQLQRPKVVYSLQNECMVFSHDYIEKLRERKVPPNELEKLYFRSFLGIPIRLYGKIIGCVALLSAYPGNFMPIEGSYEEISDIFGHILHFGLLHGIFSAPTLNISDVWEHPKAIQCKTADEINLFADWLKNVTISFDEKINDMA